MIRARKKSIATIIALVFLLSIMMPMAAFAASDDYTDFSSTYKFISTGKDKAAGTITVGPNGDFSSVPEAVYEVVVRFDLPEGVEFSETPEIEGVATGSDYVEWTFDESEYTDFTFSFTTNTIDVDSDFSGDVLVAVSVVGIGENDIVFTDWDDMRIARVASGDITVTADDPETVQMGTDTLAEITIEESQAGVFNAEDGNEIRFDIMTDGVEFIPAVYNSGTGFSALRLNPVDVINTDMEDEYEDNDRVDITVSPSTGLPGAVKFAPQVTIDPSVDGDIKIRVSSNNKNLKSTTLTVGTVGETTGVIEEVEDNDTVVYAGSQGTELDVTFEVNPVGDSFDEGDIISLTLNNGEFVMADEDTQGVDSDVWTAYNSDKSIYAVIGEDENELDPAGFTVDGLWVACDNDVEVGDIVLTADGNAGVEGEVVVGEFAKPFTVSAETPAILSEALNQGAGNIIVTEVEEGALEEDTAIFFELPSGVELKGTPDVDVTEGNIDADVKVVEGDIIALVIEGESSDASTIEISGISYNTGRLALTGPVELEVALAVPGEGEGEWDAIDGVMYVVANATVNDKDSVIASFTVGDEGVAVVNGRTLVQVNMLCDVLGLQKSWDAAAKTAYFVKDGKVVAFPMGENAIYINGVKLPVDQGGMIINDFTYATLRGLQAAFGGTLDWDPETKTATFEF